MKHQRLQWPEGKSFAFTIVDDTDHSYVHNTAPVYQLLHDLGFRTTKTVWPLGSHGAPRWHGDSCATEEYLQWVRQLQAAGFEIGYHLASSQSNTRERTAEGLQVFKHLFGEISVCANHAENLEGMYWGSDRTSGLARLAYLALNRFPTDRKFFGHIRSSPLFWGDFCRADIRWFRNFVFPDINTLKSCPYMPYYDPTRPYVRAWFASSDGFNFDRFCALVSEENQSRLEREGGACIVYTHLAYGFTEDGRVRKEFSDLMTKLSKRNGWFVPASTLLAYLEKQRGGTHTLSSWQRRRLEWSWLWQKRHSGNS